MLKIIQINPSERFSNKNRQPVKAGWKDSVCFKKGAKYYHCPKCHTRRLISSKSLDAWNPAESPFPENLKSLFQEDQEQTAYYDFYCKGCNLAVRLAYWEQETGMGGTWFPYLKSVYEVERYESVE